MIEVLLFVLLRYYAGYDFIFLLDVFQFKFLGENLFFKVKDR